MPFEIFGLTSIDTNLHPKSLVSHKSRMIHLSITHNTVLSIDTNLLKQESDVNDAFVWYRALQEELF